MNKALTAFIWLWVAIGILVNVVSLAGFFLTADSTSEALLQIWEIYNPWNFWNIAMEFLLFSPAIGAAVWRSKRRSSGKT